VLADDAGIDPVVETGTSADAAFGRLALGTQGLASRVRRVGFQTVEAAILDHDNVVA